MPCGCWVIGIAGIFEIRRVCGRLLGRDMVSVIGPNSWNLVESIVLGAAFGG